MKRNNELMDSKTMIIRNHQNTIVAEIDTLNNALDGDCKWFDAKGNKLSSGTFKDGSPWSGTILNWSKFMESETPFAIGYYAKDWITLFEGLYDSDNPDYSMIKESYREGKIIE